MKTLVLYESKYGSTKQYAEDIANHAAGDVLPLKKIKRKNLLNYDIIVFGGWVRGGNVKGLNKFLQFWDDIKEKHVLVFAVGMSFADRNTRALLIEQNLLDLYHLRFYQLRGSFDFSKLRFPDNLLINQSLAFLAKDPANAATLQSLNYVKENPIAFYDAAQVERIDSVIRKLQEEQ